jgi:hypothetical protein
VASLVGLRCSKAPATTTRYSLERDPGASIRTEYVRDRVTGNWAYREFELRVPVARPLPDPLRHPSSGDQLSLQVFDPLGTKSGGLRSIEPVVADGFRVWSGADMIGRPDVEGRTAYGVRISWVQPGAETKYDPMEVFPLEGLGDVEPGQWSPWISASTIRTGTFAWLEQVAGTPPDSLPKPENPFEFRWKIGLTEVAGRVP